jgi:hypothetical protein
MSKYSGTQKIECSMDDFIHACRFAILKLGWGIGECTDNVIVVGELQHSEWTNPAKLEIRPKSDSDCVFVQYDCSNFGFGPIQDKHVQQQARSFSEALMQGLKELALARRQYQDEKDAAEQLAAQNLHRLGIIEYGEFKQAVAMLRQNHA